MSGSNIRWIVDASAALAGTISGVTLPNGQVAGVRAVFGAGQGRSADPLRPGQTIAPATESPHEELTHVSDLPDAPTIIPLTQDGTIRLEWTVPMRLYATRGDLATARAILLPFYDAYLAAFRDWTLGGLCALAYIKSFKPAADDDWVWLDIDLYVLEEVSY